MRMREPAIALLISLTLLGLGNARADEPLPFISASAAIPPSQSPLGPNDRPTELPNIHPDDFPSLLNQRPKPDPQPPKRTPLGPKSDYDPSRLYLPDRNPGLRQPPCPCLPLGTWWVNASYFLGVTENGAIPALATTGATGVPGAPGTRYLYGNGQVDHPFRSGLQLETGMWVDRCQNWGVEGSFFFLETNSRIYQTTAAGSSVLARPYTDPNTGASAALVLGNPSSFSLNSPVSFLGAGVNFRANYLCEDHYRLDFTAGYRFISLGESLSVASDDVLSNGSSRSIEDIFRTTNQFQALQIGMSGEYRIGDWYIDGALKVAFGVTFADLNAQGQTTTNSGGSVVTTSGGFLTGPSNQGQWGYARFAVAPEATMRVGYQITEHWRAFAGYNFVYLSQVARPSQAIDAEVGAGPGGVAHPLPRDPLTDFWMQGINLGLEARY